MKMVCFYPRTSPYISRVNHLNIGDILDSCVCNKEKFPQKHLQEMDEDKSLLKTFEETSLPRKIQETSPPKDFWRETLYQKRGQFPRECSTKIPWKEIVCQKNSKDEFLPKKIEEEPVPKNKKNLPLLKQVSREISTNNSAKESLPTTSLPKRSLPILSKWIPKTISRERDLFHTQPDATGHRPRALRHKTRLNQDSMGVMSCDDRWRMMTLLKMWS